jgi:hypothetical protein
MPTASVARPAVPGTECFREHFSLVGRKPLPYAKQCDESIFFEGGPKLADLLGLTKDRALIRLRGFEQRAHRIVRLAKRSMNYASRSMGCVEESVDLFADFGR